MEDITSAMDQLELSRFRRAKSELRSRNTSSWAAAADDVQTRIASSEFTWPWTYETVPRFLTLEEAASSLSSYPLSSDGLCPTCQRASVQSILDSAGDYIHHRNGRALIESAFSCRLCTLILQSLSVNHHDWMDTLLKNPYAIRLKLNGLTLLARYKEKIVVDGQERFFIASRPLQICTPQTAHSLSLSKALLIEFIGNSMNSCFNHHSECFAKLEVPLPRRLIDVGCLADAQQTPRLWVNEKTPLSGIYTALSYCWGTDPALVLTPDNIQGFQVEIPVNRLPRTLKDAIDITRGLGIRFLWVDALCILQGNSAEARNDWSEQSVQMDTIFSMAAVVLGAASAAGSSEGIAYSPNPFKDFVEAPAHWADSRFFGHGPIFIGTSTSLDEDRPGPLYTRGWTFQERLLAARYVHIGEQQVFFECNHGRSYQQHGDNPFRYQLTKRIAVPSSFNDWHQLVQEYSRRILSVPSDNLIAVGGVAKYFSTRLRTPSAYLAGLWRANLVRDLSWHVAAPSPKLSIAPSWSWASRRTEVVYKGLGFHFCGRACAAVVEDAVQGSPNAFGHRVSGHVVIRGLLRKIFVQGAQNRFCVVGFQAPSAAAAGCADGMARDELHRVGSCVMDSPAGGDDMCPAGPRFSRYGIEGCDDVFEVWALQLHSGRGLLLKPTCAAAAEFERVGYYEYADRRHDRRRPEERGADRDPLSYAAYLVDRPFRWMEEAVKAGDEDLIEDWFGDHDAVVTLV